MPTRNRRYPRLADIAGSYADTRDTEAFQLPTNEAIAGMTDDELGDFTTTAFETAQAMQDAADGHWSQETLDEFKALAETIKFAKGEKDARAAKAEELAAEAKALAADLAPAEDEPTEDESAEDAPAEDEPAKDEPTEDEPAEAAPADTPAETTAVTASAPRQRLRTINVPATRAAQPEQTFTHRTPGKQSPARAAVNLTNFNAGAPMTLHDLGVAVADKMGAFSSNMGDQRAQYGIATITKDYRGHRVDGSMSAEAVADVLDAAAADYVANSLTAAGGWCAPSSTIYTLFDEGETDAEGMLDLPAVQVDRGGIRFARGLDYSQIAANTGFHYTEAQDQAGQYGIDPATRMGNNTAGSKPCYKVECVDFDDVRLEIDGLCIQAGLLERKAYPEVIAAAVRMALIAHSHRINGLKLNRMIAGSTAITFPQGVGATASLLSALEMEVQQYRYKHHQSQSVGLEAVMPFWVLGVLRTDLSRRLGVDLLNVTDQVLSGYMAARGVTLHFVYDFQDLPADEKTFTKWPANVSFLLYKAGTWVQGGGPIINLETIYDTVNLGQNDYTALFTEESWLIAKRGTDSRYVTVPLCASGETAGGIEVACDGTAVPAA